MKKINKKNNNKSLILYKRKKYSIIPIINSNKKMNTLDDIIDYFNKLNNTINVYNNVYTLANDGFVKNGFIFPYRVNFYTYNKKKHLIFDARNINDITEPLGFRFSDNSYMDLNTSEYGLITYDMQFILNTLKDVRSRYGKNIYICTSWDDCFVDEFRFPYKVYKYNKNIVFDSRTR